MLKLKILLYRLMFRLADDGFYRYRKARQKAWRLLNKTLNEEEGRHGTHDL